MSRVSESSAAGDLLGLLRRTIELFERHELADAALLHSLLHVAEAVAREDRTLMRRDLRRILGMSKQCIEIAIRRDPRRYPDALILAVAASETAFDALERAEEQIRPALREGSGPSGPGWSALVNAALLAGLSAGAATVYDAVAAGTSKRRPTLAQTRLQAEIAALAAQPRAPSGAADALAAKHHKKVESIKRAIARKRAKAKKG